MYYDTQVQRPPGPTTDPRMSSPPPQDEGGSEDLAAEALADEERTREVLSRLRPVGQTKQLPLQEELSALELELGRDHRETLDFAARAGKQRLEIAVYADAVGFLEQAAAGYGRTLGAEHKKTQRVNKSLAKARLAAERASKGSSFKRFMYLLLYVPMLGSLGGFVWNYTPQWIQRGVVMGGAQVVAALHDGPCAAAGLCTPFASQLAELYTGYYKSRHEERRQKLDGIPQLLEKWTGKEMELVAAVNEKYGESRAAQAPDGSYAETRWLRRLWRYARDSLMGAPRRG